MTDILQNPAALTDADWRARLTSDAYHILREKGTERAFTGLYTDTDTPGIYHCKGCHAPLFVSDNKFHSGCGWASFDDALPGALTETVDTSHAMRRIEITCSHCGGHLGHVFPDGPRNTTGLRYCVNSGAVDLEAL